MPVPLTASRTGANVQPWWLKRLVTEAAHQLTEVGQACHLQKASPTAADGIRLLCMWPCAAVLQCTHAAQCSVCLALCVPHSNVLLTEQLTIISALSIFVYMQWLVLVGVCTHLGESACLASAT